MAKEIKTIGVLTSGGDAPGMNAATMTLQNWKNYYYLLILKTEILKRETDKHYRKTVSLFFFSCSTTNALANYSSSVIVIVQLWHSQCAPASLLPLTPACTLT